MIGEVSISNFKSILSQRFKLGRVNVFVGCSGSGKTNILEALGMAAAAHDDALDRDSLVKRGINPTKMFHSSQGEIEISWYEKNSWKKAKLISHDNGESWKDTSWYETAYIQKMNNLIQFIGDGSIEGKYPFADESKNATLNAAFRGSRNFRDYTIYRLKNSDLHMIEAETIEKIFSAFNLEQTKTLSSYAEKPEVMLYLSLFSERRSPAIFAIDGIDSFLEPELCSKLMPFVSMLSAKHNKQVLITINNPDVVKEMDLSLPEQKLFSVKINESGQTVVKKVKNKSIVEI